MKNKLVTFRKIASIVLLVCFFLPLSRCSEIQGDGSTTYDYRFAFDHFSGVLNDGEGEPAIDTSQLPLLLITSVIFFVPAAIWKLSTKTQSLMEVVLAVPAEWLLYEWATVGDAQIGGVLAILSWLVLFIVGLMQLWQVLQDKRSSESILQ